MARWVRVASLPAAPMQPGNPRDFAACVEEERVYWQGMLERVLPDRPDLIVTPECCDRPAGLTGRDRAAYYAERGERMLDFFKKAARDHHTNIAYGAVRGMPDGTFRNAIQFINRRGGLDGIYNKHVLVVEEYTEHNILYGREIQAVQTDIGRVCGAICFDLNFDLVLRQTAAQKPELIVFSSAYHGGLMQAHWAYQCRAYFVSCIFGTETASVINPVGEVVGESSNYVRHLVQEINLDYAVVHLDYNEEKLRAAKAKYGPGIELRTPYGLGCVLLSSREDGLSAADVVKEFGMELWADYYARALAARQLPGRIEPA